MAIADEGGAGSPQVEALPRAGTLTPADLRASLRAGWDDFRAAPSYGLVFGAVYALLGAGGLALALGLGWSHLVFPALSGFLIFGPFAALGLYEISRERAAGQALDARRIFLAFRRHGGTQLAMLGLLLVIMTIFWLKTAGLIYALFFGLSPVDFLTLVGAVFGTATGAQFALVGTATGALFAGTMFALSVFAVPMLLDRDLDVITAMIASVTAVRENFQVMVAWGAVVALLMAAGMLVGLVGLVVALPVVGHATWHLYVRAFRAS